MLDPGDGGPVPLPLFRVTSAITCLDRVCKHYCVIMNQSVELKVINFLRIFSLDILMISCVKLSLMERVVM
jgi:hypothetical protein